MSLIGPLLWEITDANGAVTHSRADLGHAITLLATPCACARRCLPGHAHRQGVGYGLARLGGDPTDRRADLSVDAVAVDDAALQAEGDDDEEAPLKEIVIAPPSCSVDGAPVEAIEPLGFLSAGPV